MASFDSFRPARHPVYLHCPDRVLSRASATISGEVLQLGRGPAPNPLSSPAGSRPPGRPGYGSRSSVLRIFPVGPLGSSPRNLTSRGYW